MYTFSHTSSSHRCSDLSHARSYMTASCLRSVVCISYFPLQSFSDTKAWEAEGTEPIGHSHSIIWKCRAGNTVGPLLTNGEQELMDKCFPLLYLGQIPERCFIRLLQGSCRTEHQSPVAFAKLYWLSVSLPYPSLLLSRITSQINYSAWKPLS